jgi:hypothetical protein
MKKKKESKGSGCVPNAYHHPPNLSSWTTFKPIVGPFLFCQNYLFVPLYPLPLN